MMVDEEVKYFINRISLQNKKFSLFRNEKLYQMTYTVFDAIKYKLGILKVYTPENSIGPFVDTKEFVLLRIPLQTIH